MQKLIYCTSLKYSKVVSLKYMYMKTNIRKLSTVMLRIDKSPKTGKGKFSKYEVTAQNVISTIWYVNWLMNY